MSYELRAAEEARMWKQKLLRKASFWERSSKKAQNKMNGMIPEKVHILLPRVLKR